MKTHIIEVTVDSLRRSLGEAFGHIGLLVVECVVEPDALQPLALLVRPGEPDHIAAFDLGDLPDQASDSPGGARHHHSLSGLRLADFEEAEVGRVAGHPTGSDEQALAQAAGQVRCGHHASEGSARRVLAHLVRVNDAALDPAGHEDDGLAHGEVRVPALLHLGNAAPNHCERWLHPGGGGDHVSYNEKYLAV